jgi:hypothetical protein
VGAALGIATIGSVFFGAVETFTPTALREADVTASWWVIAGFLVCAASTVLLPDRETVHDHARAQTALAWPRARETEDD